MTVEMNNTEKNKLFVISDNQTGRQVLELKPTDLKEDSLGAYLTTFHPDFDFYINTTESTKIQKMLSRTSLFGFCGKLMSLPTFLSSYKTSINSDSDLQDSAIANSMPSYYYSYYTRAGQDCDAFRSVETIPEIPNAPILIKDQHYFNSTSYNSTYEEKMKSHPPVGYLRDATNQTEFQTRDFILQAANIENNYPQDHSAFVIVDPETNKKIEVKGNDIQEQELLSSDLALGSNKFVLTKVSGFPAFLQGCGLLREGNHRVIEFTISMLPTGGGRYSTNRYIFTEATSHSLFKDHTKLNSLIQESYSRDKIPVFCTLHLKTTPVDKDTFLATIQNYSLELTPTREHSTVGTFKLPRQEHLYAKQDEDLINYLLSISASIEGDIPVMFYNFDTCNKYKGVQSYTESNIKEVLFDSVITFATPHTIIEGDHPGYRGYSSNTRDGMDKFIQKIKTLYLENSKFPFASFTHSTEAIPNVVTFSKNRFDRRSSFPGGVHNVCGVNQLPQGISHKDYAVHFKVVLFKNGKPKLLAIPVYTYYLYDGSHFSVQVDKNNKHAANAKQVRGKTFLQVLNNLIKISPTGDVSFTKTTFEDRLNYMLKLLGIDCNIREFVNLYENKLDIPLCREMLINLNTPNRPTLTKQPETELQNKVINTGKLPSEAFNDKLLNNSSIPYVIRYTTAAGVAVTGYTDAYAEGFQSGHPVFGNMLAACNVDNFMWAEWRALCEGNLSWKLMPADLPFSDDKEAARAVTRCEPIVIFPICVQENISIPDDIIEKIQAYVMMDYL